MNKVFTVATNIISSLGFSPEENAIALGKAQTGIACYPESDFSSVPCYASKVSEERLNQTVTEYDTFEFTKFEKLLIASMKLALSKIGFDLPAKDTVYVFSTTKGNIDKIGEGKRINIPESINYILKHFSNINSPVIVSNACISGSAAIIYAQRLLLGGKYKHAVVAGADVLSEFTVSGFQSFKALSTGSCKPFDKERDGVTLGEGAGTIILTTEKSLSKNEIGVSGGGISNDANHISGPSRTGDGLCNAITSALREASHVSLNSIQYLSAHGTATPYNDEMECKAFHLAGVESLSINSLKGYFGHTLGAAGIIESVMGIYSMENGIIFPSVGYEEHGVSLPINIVKETRNTEVNAFLKTSSGFGGCNSAIIFSK